MRTRFLFGMLTLLSALGFSSPAVADLFTGTLYLDAWCDDCKPLGDNVFGAGPASAAISLTDYNWDDSLTGHVAGFTYTSERVGTLSPAYVYNVEGSFSSVASAPADVTLEFNIFGDGGAHYTFQSNVGGAWHLTPDLGVIPLDVGSSHTWGAQPVPEPETYAMMLAGLGLLGFAARRRKQRAA